jgi:hypothetical protein
MPLMNVIQCALLGTILVTIAGVLAYQQGGFYPLGWIGILLTGVTALGLAGLMYRQWKR